MATDESNVYTVTPWCLLLALLIPGLGRPEPSNRVLTLHQAIDIALQQNPSLENAQLEVSKAGESVKATRARELPSLTLSVIGSRNLAPQSYHFNAGVFGSVPLKSVDIPARGDYSSVVSLSLNQPLSGLYRLGLSVDQKKVTKKLAEQQLRANRQQVARQVKRTYYTLLKMQNLLQASAASTAFYVELQRVVRQNYRHETALKYQLLEVQSHLARSRYETSAQRSRMQTKEEQLNELLGRDVKERFRVTKTGMNVQPLPTLAKAEATALAQRPELHEATLKLKHAEYGYRIERSKYLPNVSLRLRYSRLYNTVLLPGEDSAVELTARWKFFDWGRKAYDLDKTTAAIGQARNRVRQARARVLADVDSSLRKVRDARDRVQVTELAVAAAQEKARVLMNQYREKTALLDDVLKAQSEWMDAVTEHANAKLAVWTARAALTHAMGEE